MTGPVTDPMAQTALPWPPCSSLAKRYKVGDDHLCQTDDSTPTGALDTAPNEERGEILGDGDENGSNSK